MNESDADGSKKVKRGYVQLQIVTRMHMFVWRALSGFSGQKSCSSPNIPLSTFARRALTASEMLPRRGGVDQPESSIEVFSQPSVSAVCCD